MTKEELRSKYKAKRAEFTQDDIDEKSIAMANQLLKLPIWEHQFYHIFLPIKKQKEVNTELILPLLKGRDKNIVVSKTDFESKKMHHYLLTDNTVLKKNRVGIPEPENGIAIAAEQLEVVFVPLFAFDETGHRVGFGGGFYDAFLEECSPGTKKVGLSFFPPEPELKGIHSRDIPLDFCVTPEALYSFS